MSVALHLMVDETETYAHEKVEDANYDNNCVRAQKLKHVDVNMDSCSDAA